MNIDLAYELIAKVAIIEAGNMAWDQLLIEVTVYVKSARTLNWAVHDGEKKQGNIIVPIAESRKALEAKLFLRDNILKTTGKRIWGFKLTLNKDGKFNIEYDYNKPEDYDDSGEEWDENGIREKS